MHFPLQLGRHSDLMSARDWLAEITMLPDRMASPQGGYALNHDLMTHSALKRSTADATMVVVRSSKPGQRKSSNWFCTPLMLAIQKPQKIRISTTVDSKGKLTRIGLKINGSWSFILLWNIGAWACWSSLEAWCRIRYSECVRRYPFIDFKAACILVEKS